MVSLALSVILLLFSIYLFQQKWSSTVTGVLVAAISLVLLILSAGYFVADYFTGVGIDESVIFHLRYGLGGAGFGEYLPLMVGALLFCILAVVLSIIVFRSLSTNERRGFLPARLFALVLLISALTVNPANRDLVELYRDSMASSGTPAEFAELYADPVIKRNGREMNLVFVYLESVERTYFDEALFPGLVPELSALERESLTFTDVRQVTGTGWTIAGINASQCGVPLVTPANGNSMSGVDEFMPGATCIGDLLRDEGYYLDYMGGAPTEFAGKEKFLNTHGFNSIQGRDELLDKIDDRDYVSSWGLYDDSLFGLAEQRFLELAEGVEPFGLFLLTLDTHHPDGHISAPCRGSYYQDGSNPILNAIHCADRQIASFVERIRQSPYADNTLIVLASDHLALRNTAWDTLQQGERRNLFMLIDPRELVPDTNNRPASILDVGPTVLSKMGLETEGLGFGRNLLSDSTTLVESRSNADHVLSRHRDFVARMWNFPQLDNGLAFTEANMKINIGSRNTDVPALFVLDDDAHVQDVRFEFDSPEKLYDQLTELPQHQPLIWVDTCTRVSVLDGLTINQPPVPDNELVAGTLADDARWCAAVGRLNSETLAIFPVNNSFFISKAEVENFITFSAVKRNLYRERITKLESLEVIEAYGTPNLQEVQITDQRDLSGDIVLGSFAYDTGESYVRTAKAGSESSTRASFTRGLTLLGLDTDQVAIKLAHADTCEPDNPIEDNATLEVPFAEAIELSTGDFGAYAVIAHDSARCVEYDMSDLFAGLELEEWRHMGFRQPYIGVIAGNGETREFLGEPESSLAVRLKNFVAVTEVEQQIRNASLPNVAHAGGSYNNRTYTNSINALEENSVYFKLFEIDFSWTADGHIVCLHDWDQSFVRSFGHQTPEVLTLREFTELIENGSDVEKCTLASLVDWMVKNPEASIVTDVRENNPDVLRRIASDYPDLMSRFIPQIYQPAEYWLASDLGFENIIWTLYRYAGTDQDVLEILDRMDLYALTMPKERADRGLAGRVSERRGLNSYVHTVNDPEEAEAYFEKGIAAVYTDSIRE